MSDHEPVWSTFRVQYHAPVPRLRHDSSGGGWGGGGIGGASLGFGGGGLGLAEALAEEAHRFGLGFESSSDLRIEVSCCASARRPLRPALALVCVGRRLGQDLAQSPGGARLPAEAACGACGRGV